MGKNPKERFSEGVQELFSSGTVILFTCEATEDFPILTVSHNAEDILGFSPSYFQEHENGWSNRIHPDDKKYVTERFREVLTEGTAGINEYRFKTKDGSYIWLRDEIKLVENPEQEPVIYGSSIDITDRKKAEIALKENKTAELKAEISRRKDVEKKLQKRLAYEKAISECSELLLASTSSESLRKSLNILQGVTNADRIFLYRNHEREGELYLEPELEVTAKGVDQIADNLDRKLKYSDFPWLYNKLSNLERVQARVNDLPEAERSILEEQGVKSLLVIPIMVDDKWSGYIGFADTKENRVWEEEEVTLIETAARVIAAFQKRRVIERSLRNQRNYTNTILNSLPAIYLLMDEDFNFLKWNNSALQETGYTADELKNKSAFDVIIPEDHEELRRSQERVQEQRSEGAELCLLSKSGEEIPYFWRGYYIELEGEKYFLCVGINITRQKETEKELLDEKRFNEALLESLPGIFYMFDEEGNYERWNQNLLDETGYSVADMTKITPAVFFEGEELDFVENEIKKVFESGNSDIEANLVTRDGKKIPYYLTGKLFERDGEKYVVGVGHDITEQKKYEEEIYSSLKEKHVLLQEIHHRVKNNLAVVSGLLQLQMYETDDPVIRETLRESENRIQTMALIHEKLYNSQNLSRISCDSYIGDLVETIRNTIQTENEIAVETDIAEVKININMAVPFALLLNEVVTNSFKHAFKGIEKGKISINLSKEGDHIHAEIKDNGIGLSNDLPLGERDTLGMNLIHSFAEQLEAEWDMGTDNGTYIDLKFKVDDVNGSPSSHLDL